MSRTDATKYPSTEADRFQVRLPDGLRDEIRKAAADNNRSMNAEIVARLSMQQVSLRDWFAGQALAGVLANQSTQCGSGDQKTFDDVLATRCFEVADAMLAAREKAGA